MLLFVYYKIDRRLKYYQVFGLISAYWGFSAEYTTQPVIDTAATPPSARTVILRGTTLESVVFVCHCAIYGPGLTVNNSYYLPMVPATRCPSCKL